MSTGKCAGVIIRKAEGDIKTYLTEYRLVEPKGLALPMGHIIEGELPGDTVFRKIFEDAGLYVDQSGLVLVFHEFLGNSCPKCKGVHEWFVYEATVDDGEPTNRNPERNEFVSFMSVDQMRPYMSRNEANSAWFRFILPALRII